ncbi:MAG: DUF2905 domain-containing protein [Chlorobiaceae bacterium]|nr:DUF2905 domain-containing protein [Chlorobiaceae bacterium]NTV61687.1 DUF2905 domain-containing protein [Chlorobiaceae bacterium]
MFSEAGKILVIGGLAAILFGLALMAASKAGNTGWFHWIGNLPLDIRIEKENFRFYFPIGTSIMLSILLSLVMYIIGRFMSR